jgi:hypothetical protein
VKAILSIGKEKMKQEPFIKTIKSIKLFTIPMLAKRSGINYLRLWRIFNKGWKPRDEEIAKLQQAVSSFVDEFNVFNKKGN